MILSPSDCTPWPAFVMNFRFFSIPRQEGFGTKVTKSFLNSSFLLTELVTFGEIDSRLILTYYLISLLLHCFFRNLEFSFAENKLFSLSNTCFASLHHNIIFLNYFAVFNF